MLYIKYNNIANAASTNICRIPEANIIRKVENCAYNIIHYGIIASRIYRLVKKFHRLFLFMDTHFTLQAIKILSHQIRSIFSI